jgi:hypothetical protein
MRPKREVRDCHGFLNVTIEFLLDAFAMITRV